MTKEKKLSLLTVVIFLVILALPFVYDLSPYAYRDYDRICHSLNNTQSDLDKCFNPYWTQYHTLIRFSPVLVISALAAVVAVLAF